jgi:hypothetical protein
MLMMSPRLYPLTPSSSRIKNVPQYKRIVLPTKKDGTYVGLQLSRSTYTMLTKKRTIMSLCDAPSSIRKYVRDILIYLGFSQSIHCSDIDIIGFETPINKAKKTVLSISSTCTGVAVGERAFTTNFFTGNTLHYGISTILFLLKALPSSIERDRGGIWRRSSTFDRTYTEDVNGLYKKSLAAVDTVLRKVYY